ncbi:hypothetical protein [Francisella adeliensis]|uniref:Beta-carotene 15,15'-monooxygenase n=1 Tax=Francisella adeliensis TaxID=2007306 RepID=A0A2Z4XY99_9GAMM|nr:hypothetical protein [Francisella adeliensis]AXA33598.1 hypothetical protein CDH04_03870 [Francisella adeliensis]MBK2085159.1 hypothetical protein [Francisella adeliensis]MBK2097364.1 hypothetical protein [Francisella adeliensis]QIW11830.1 hypothetical protein FZC43_03870 [Francisella adeliensis]QIW13706.1 hypothetical protein FZC44_03870 [Francisella adeliensis]
MSSLNYKETISLAVNIYKRSFKIAFALAFMLSFISEFCMVYMMNHGMLEFIENEGKEIPANFPPGEVLALMMIVIVVATIFVYAMILLLQGIFIKQKMKQSDALKLSLQIFSKRVFAFIGAFFLSMIIMSMFTMFLQYIGMFLAILLFVTVFPNVLLEQKNVFDAIKSNFSLLKSDTFYMIKISISILALMIIKSLITVGLVYGLKSLSVEINPLESSLQNIIVTIIESFIMPFILAITVAVFLATRKEKNIS